MKNQYVGDIGDYSKLGLISTLISLDQNIKLGINWYQFDGTHHTESPNDGKHYTYLTKKRKDYKKLSDLFPDIYKDFETFFTKNVKGTTEIAKEKRLIQNLEHISCLTKVLFYSEDICNKDRKEWFEKSVDCLDKAEIIFLDPDNGLEYARGTGGVKHVLIDELKEYYSKGNSVILYNHRDRKPTSTYLTKFKDAANEIGTCDDCLRIIRANKGTVRDYVFFTQKKHKTLINSLFDKLNTEKDYLFQEVCLKKY